MLLRPHHHHHLSLFLLPFLLLLLLPQPVKAQDEEDVGDPITISALITAVEEGDTAQLECSNAASEDMEWFKGDNASTGAKLPEAGSERVFFNGTTGMLTVGRAEMGDTGVYLCRTASGNHSVTGELHVYEMPSYFEEGMVLLGVGAGLLLVMAACALHAVTREKKKKASEAKRRLAKPSGRRGEQANVQHTLHL